MSNLIEIYISKRVSLSVWFVKLGPGGTHAYGELLLSLKYLTLFTPALHEGDWVPLTTFLSCRASIGNRLESLMINACSHMCLDVVEDIERVVECFEVSWTNNFDELVCPHGKCLAPEVDLRDYPPRELVFNDDQ